MIKAVNIVWDTDGEDELCLPNEIAIPADFASTEDEISDYISALTGFCHKGFELAGE